MKLLGQKMLERLLSRSDEDKIKEKAELLIKNSKSELIIKRRTYQLPTVGNHDARPLRFNIPY